MSYNRNSRPSELKITDLRFVIVGHDHWRWPLIQIYTNQGVTGLGEVRDGASVKYALMLKSRLLGENPCNVERLFRKISPFGGHGRQGGGVCGVEMALMDLAGKAYGVPAYMLAGGKYRDRVKVYADTPSQQDPRIMAERMQSRVEKGYQFLKMDLGISLLEGVEGALIQDPQVARDPNLMHPFTGTQITRKGIEHLVEYARVVREHLGATIPIAIDHFGHIGLDSCIRLGRALDPFTFAWYEDMLPWQYPKLMKAIKDAVETPVCTGEDIYLRKDFKVLLDEGCVSYIHPDLATSGGILETKRIGDLAQEYGVPMVLHQAGSPVVALANVHCAAATENFVALEMHSVDLAWWEELVTFEGDHIVEDGHVRVPEAPGLGIELNEEAVQAHLNPPSAEYGGYFEPTDSWDLLDSHDRLWS
ncbi:MAG: mandelate racemase/muconate lactonizing enzyme family protein [bacterium]|jgi:L-alanine-DL-glutamate epimerase-like enolase superfamily enzyme